MTVKISPSLPPYSHAASVMSCGATGPVAPVPSPAPSGPWHFVHSRV
jgi:hypothetical protein